MDGSIENDMNGVVIEDLSSLIHIFHLPAFFIPERNHHLLFNSNIKTCWPAGGGRGQNTTQGKLQGIPEKMSFRNYHQELVMRYWQNSYNRDPAGLRGAVQKKLGGKFSQMCEPTH